MVIESHNDVLAFAASEIRRVSRCHGIALALVQIAQFAGANRSSPATERFACRKISTDSRTIKPGELFVALRGENFDGHKFVEAAAKARRGRCDCRSSIGTGKSRRISRSSASRTRSLAYQHLAANYRQSLPPQSARHHRQQRQDEHERFCRLGSGAAISRHENGRQFQQSRRPAAHHAGGDIARTKSASGKSG